MFIPIVLIALGLAMLLNTMGIMSGTFWGIVFIAFGLKMLIQKNGCIMCGGWKKMHQKFNSNCCGHNHEE